MAFQGLLAATARPWRKGLVSMRMLRIIAPVLLALTLLVTLPAAIGAQGEETTGFEDIEGLRKAYARTFNADMAAMFGPATPGAMPSGWFALSAMVLEFDSEDHAAAGLDTLLDEIASSELAGEDGEMEDVELDIDMDHVARRDVIEAEGGATTVLLALAQDGTYVYAVVGVTYGEDPVPVATSVLTMLQEAEASDDEEVYRADGTSDGGLWGKMPAAEDVMREAPALVEVMDETLYPSLASPAISTPARVEVTPATVGTPAG